MIVSFHSDWLRRFIVVVVGCVVLSPSLVMAQSPIDEAGQLFEEASFEDALEVLQAAEQGSGLDRDGVIRLLVLRAFVHHALGQQDDLDRALRELATIEPGYVMDASFPPALRGRLEVIQSRDVQPLGLSVDTSAVGGGYEIRVRVNGDPVGIIRGVSIFTRIEDGEWLQSEGNVARIPLAPGNILDFFVQATGPGGALLLEEGSADEPLHLGEEGEPRIPEPSPQPPERQGLSPWIWVGIGAGIVAVIAVVVLGAVLGTRQDDTTNIGPLEVDWP